MSPTVNAAPSSRAPAIEDTALWKAVVLSEANRFTGALRVSDGAREGTISFDDGRVVHAECGDLRGEPALRALMRWPSSSYTVTDQRPAERSISRPLAAVVAELRTSQATPAQRPPARPQPAAWIASATEKIRALPGVLGAALESADGSAGPLGPRTPAEAAALAVLAPARRLSEALALGRPILAIARGADRLVLLVALREHRLAVLVRDEDQADAVRAQIRALLNPPQ